MTNFNGVNESGIGIVFYYIHTKILSAKHTLELNASTSTLWRTRSILNVFKIYHFDIDLYCILFEELDSMTLVILLCRV